MRGRSWKRIDKDWKISGSTVIVSGVDAMLVTIFSAQGRYDIRDLRHQDLRDSGRHASLTSARVSDGAGLAD